MFLVTQDAAHIIEGSAERSRCACVDRPSRSLDEQFRKQGSEHRAYLAAVQRCSSKRSITQQRAAQEMLSRKDDCLRQALCFL